MSNNSHHNPSVNTTLQWKPTINYKISVRLACVNRTASVGRHEQKWQGCLSTEGRPPTNRIPSHAFCSGDLNRRDSKHYHAAFNTSDNTPPDTQEFFCSYDSDLDLMTLIWTWPKYLHTKNELSRSRLSKSEHYRQTDRCDQKHDHATW